MTTLDTVLQPNVPQSRATHLKENFVIGWIPATIRGITDENKLGRIEIESELISPNTILPAWEDCKVIVLEDFTCPNSKGGSHRFLQNDTQVALIPMMGNPSCLLMIGCIPSIVDQPSPELDRSQGLYGSVTPGQVYKVNNDSDGSSIDARPSGAVQHVSGGGDITAQTRNGARQTLHADGTVEQQNLMASSVISPDGSIQVTNFAKGYSLLKPDGSWELKSSSKASLKLEDKAAELKAPLNPISQAIKELSQQLPKAMSLVKETLSKAQTLIEDYQSHKSLDFLLSNLSPLLKQAEEVKPIIEKALGSLEQLSKTKFDEIAEHLLPQAEKFLNSNLDQVFLTVKKAVENPIEGDTLIKTLIDVLPSEFRDTLNSVEPTIVEALNHNKDAQIQYILSHLLSPDGGIESIQGVLGLDLHEVLADIQGCFNIQQPDWLNTGLVPTPRQQEDWQTLITQAEQNLASLIPESLKTVFTKSDITELIQTAVLGGNPLHDFMGKAGSKFIENLIPQMSEVVKIGSGLPVINNFVSGLSSGGDIPELMQSLSGHFNLPEMDSLDLNSAINTALPLALTAMSGGLGGGLIGAIGGTNALSSIFGKSKSGGILRLTKNSVEAKASESGSAAKLVITKPKASLVGIGGLTELFASRSKAGVKTPWGSFGLGSGGGGFFSKAQMAFRVFQSAGKSAGVLLHPKHGVSLASFEDSKFDQEDTSTWKRKSAEITVDDGVVIIRSHRSTDENHGIVVSPEGVFIEGFRIRDLFKFSERLAILESTIENALLWQD